MTCVPSVERSEVPPSGAHSGHAHFPGKSRGPEYILRASLWAPGPGGDGLCLEPCPVFLCRRCGRGGIHATTPCPNRRVQNLSSCEPRSMSLNERCPLGERPRRRLHRDSGPVPPGRGKRRCAPHDDLEKERRLRPHSDGKKAWSFRRPPRH